VIDQDGDVIPLSDARRKDIMDTIYSFASDALRTLCLAFKDVDDFDENADSPSSGFTLIIIFGIKDPVRPGVKEAVQSCITAGIMVRMVTGDNINTAKAIAKECGILTDDGIAIEGPDFRNKSPEELRDLIPKIQVDTCFLHLLSELRSSKINVSQPLAGHGSFITIGQTYACDKLERYVSRGCCCDG
jgi:Ca2+-transporting ATPase